MLRPRFDIDEEQKIRTEIMLNLLNEYPFEESKRRVYRTHIEEECKRIKVVGPRARPIILWGKGHHGEYYSEDSLYKTRIVVEKLIFNKVKEKIKNGVLNDSKSVTKPIHK